MPWPLHVAKFLPVSWCRTQLSGTDSDTQQHRDRVIRSAREQRGEAPAHIPCATFTNTHLPEKCLSGVECDAAAAAPLHPLQQLHLRQSCGDLLPKIFWFKQVTFFQQTRLT